MSAAMAGSSLTPFCWRTASPSSRSTQSQHDAIKSLQAAKNFRECNTPLHMLVPGGAGRLACPRHIVLNCDVAKKSAVSGRTSLLQPTAVNSILHEVNALRAEGRQLVSLMRGEPDFRTPGHIVEAAVRALQDGRTAYPDNRGEPK